MGMSGHAGECDSTSQELKEAQKAGAELMQDKDELSAQLAGLEQQLADMTQAHDDARHTTNAPLLFQHTPWSVCQRM